LADPPVPSGCFDLQHRVQPIRQIADREGIGAGRTFPMSRVGLQVQRIARGEVQWPDRHGGLCAGERRAFVQGAASPRSGRDPGPRAAAALGDAVETKFAAELRRIGRQREGQAAARQHAESPAEVEIAALQRPTANVAVAPGRPESGRCFGRYLLLDDRHPCQRHLVGGERAAHANASMRHPDQIERPRGLNAVGPLIADPFRSPGEGGEAVERSGDDQTVVGIELNQTRPQLRGQNRHFRNRRVPKIGLGHVQLGQLAKTNSPNASGCSINTSPSRIRTVRNDKRRPSRSSAVPGT
jgi:hypothetical protein